MILIKGVAQSCRRGDEKSPSMTMRFVVIYALLAGSICCSHAEGRTALQRRGETLAKRLCADCHAIGRTDQSPHAGAPALRTLEHSVDIDTFVRRLRRGLTSGHPDMLTFRFSRRDARDFVLYLRSIQAP